MLKHRNPSQQEAEAAGWPGESPAVCLSILRAFPAASSWSHHPDVPTYTRGVEGEGRGPGWVEL